MRRIQNQIIPTRSTTPTTPPIAPPIIAPVSELDFEDCEEVEFPAFIVGFAVSVDEDEDEDCKDCEGVGFAALVEVTEPTV